MITDPQLGPIEIRKLSPFRSAPLRILPRACRVRATRRSEFFEAARVGQQFAQDAPGLAGGGVEGGRGAGLEEVEAGDEVVRAAAVLQAGDELQQDTVDAVAEARVLPVGVLGVLLALVENERADVVVVDRPAG